MSVCAACYGAMQKEYVAAIGEDGLEPMVILMAEDMGVEICAHVCVESTCTCGCRSVDDDSC